MMNCMFFYSEIYCYFPCSYTLCNNFAAMGFNLVTRNFLVHLLRWEYGLGFVLAPQNGVLGLQIQACFDKHTFVCYVVHIPVHLVKKQQHHSVQLQKLVTMPHTVSSYSKQISLRLVTKSRSVYSRWHNQSHHSSVRMLHLNGRLTENPVLHR